MEVDVKTGTSTSAGDAPPIHAISRSVRRKKMKKLRPKPNVQEMQRFEFAELNLLHTGNPTKTLQLVRRAIQMGYDSVVINIDVGELDPVKKDEGGDEPPTKKKKKAKNAEAQQPKTNAIPEPFLVDESQLDVSQIEANGKKFRQFSRLTVTLNNSVSVHKLQHHPKRALYDVVAIRCPDEAILTTMTRKGDLFDIITLDSKQQTIKGRISWIHKQKLIQSCIKEGVSFEVCYGEALKDNELRRQFFINARALALISNKGRGIVLSSGAETVGQIRGAYDAANMCTLFGMKTRQGNKLVSENCCKLLLRSQARRTIKGAIHIADIGDAPAPPNIKRDAHLAALSAIPEFQEQMKPKFELVETS